MNHSIQFLKQAWTPDLIDTLGWYDPSDSSTITESGGAVSQLDDKSGNAKHLTASVGSEPTTGTRTQNSLNVLDCSSTDHMDKTSFGVPTSGDIAFFMVGIVDVVDADADSIFSMDAASNDFQFEAGNASQFDGEIVTGLFANINLTGGPYAGPSIYELVWDYGSSCKPYVDGTNDGSAGYSGGKLDSGCSLHIFTNRVQNNYPDGAFGEIIIVEDCSDRCRKIIEGYLAHKWGLTANLPAGHPFKQAEPYA